MEKQIKPEIPDIPELPSEVKIDEPIDLKDLNKNNSQTDPNKVNSSENLSPEELAKKQQVDIVDYKTSEEIKILDSKIKELELKLQEQNEKAEKDKVELAENYKKKEEELIAKQELEKETKELEIKKAN
ncbi:MAG: hypothetical protein ACKOXJ_02825, partial [Alphaproteobacteria bacterium]